MPVFPRNAISFDPQLCRQCSGRCCQGFPGLWASPERFGALFCCGKVLTPAILREVLPELELELRLIGGVPIPAPRALKTGCIFLGDGGCRLPRSHRPCQCLALIPDLETLLDDVIHCRLPPEFGTGTVRQRWRLFWAQHPL